MTTQEELLGWNPCGQTDIANISFHLVSYTSTINSKKLWFGSPLDQSHYSAHASIFTVRGPKLCYISYLPEAKEGNTYFVFWFSRTQEMPSKISFQKNFVLYHKCFLFSRKIEGPCPLWFPRLRGSAISV